MGSYNHNDTITTPVEISTPELDFEHDYALSSATENEAVYAYTKSELDQPESVRFANDSVNNVYSGTQIQPTLFSVNKKGRKLLCSIIGTFRDTAADGTVTDYPVKTGITVTFPISARVDASAVMEQLKRNINCFFGHVDSADKLDTMMRGIVLQ